VVRFPEQSLWALFAELALSTAATGQFTHLAASNDFVSSMRPWKVVTSLERSRQTKILRVINYLFGAPERIRTSDPPDS
jgi:hypothetical protein